MVMRNFSALDQSSHQNEMKMEWNGHSLGILILMLWSIKNDRMYTADGVIVFLHCRGISIPLGGQRITILIPFSEAIRCTNTTLLFFSSISDPSAVCLGLWVDMGFQ